MKIVGWVTVVTMAIMMVPNVAGAERIGGTVAEKTGRETTAVTDSSKVVDLDEVIVVTQPKESYTLRRQPMSSSVFTGRELTALRVEDVRNLTAFVPSFVMPEYGSRLTSAIYIRGIGSRINNPAVGMYLDGMPLLSKSAFNMHNYQVDRIDVLRGPQGTLYGQNTEGGLVRIYSKNPMEYQGTDVKIGLGTRMQRTAEVAHFHRPTQNLAFSVATFYDGTNGYLKNAATGGRADDRNEAGAKARLLYKPSEKLTVDYIADYQYTRQNGFAYGLLDTGTNSVAAPETTHRGNYRRNIFNTGLNIGFQTDRLHFNSMTTYQYLNDYMLMDNDYLAADYMWLEERQLQNSLAQEFTLKGKIGERWRHTSGVFFSHQWLKTNAPVYFGGSMTTPIATAAATSIRNAIVNSMAESMIAGGMPPQAALAQAQAAVERAGGVSMSMDIRVPGLFHTPQSNVGIFHESNIDLASNLMLTLGLRYDYNHVKISYDTSALMTMTANVMGREAVNTLSSQLTRSTSNDYNQLLPKFGLIYKLPKDYGNVYATVTKGFRAGGFNIQMFSDVLQTELMANRDQAMRGDYEVQHTDEDYANVNNTISYKPEESWNYEVGTHLNLFGGRVHTDIAAYYMQVRNQQLSVMAGTYGFGRMMVNAGKSYSCGFEIALRGKELDNRLSWSANYAYTRSVFRDYEDGVNVGGEEQTIDYSGKRVPFVPMHTLGAGLAYTIQFSQGMLSSLTVGADLSAMGRIYWDEANSYSQPFYALLGAHVDGIFGATTISLWAKNITNTVFNTFAMDSSATGSRHYFAQRGMPFMAGVEVRLHF